MLLFSAELKQSPEKISYMFKDLLSEAVININVWEVITFFKDH